MQINTRVAPSPTGVLHLGTIRTAYHNWLVAKATGGKFVVRIDDTDLKRSKDEFITPIFDTLDYLGLSYDFTFKQSERMKVYRSEAQKLIEGGKAYQDGDAILLNNGFCLIKTDGTATYNFASTVDDLMSEIPPNLILRGSDHYSNLPKQAFIARKMGYRMPKVQHVGLMLKPEGGKLSKRDSDSFVNIYNYHPEAILNFVLRLGWSPTKDDKSNNLINKEKATKLILKGGKFRLSNMQVDKNKLDWYNRVYNKIA